ncbi:ammonium transporter [Akkermansiaceae bacterium]|nr:ammonium transporter [Akkermansiaceae bacterium]
MLTLYALFFALSLSAFGQDLDQKMDLVLEKLDTISTKLDPVAKDVSVETPEAEASPDSEGLAVKIDTVFVIICAALVFFMQAGFALLELGCVRAKNCLNVGADVTWLSSFDGSSGIWTFWIFQAVFVATAATITSGAMAERIKFSGYILYTIVISAVIYPVLGHWAWGSFGGGLADGFGGDPGWLEKMGFQDFAGSTVVHGLGGACALAGVLVVGPRKGRFSKDGTPLLISGHNIPLVALGTFILTFGWFGFNCGSMLSADASIGRIAVNTIVAGGAGGLFSMLAFWFRDGRSEPLSMLNGILGGLVAITACCNLVTPASAVAIGAIAGIIGTIGAEALLKLRIDDVVGAIPVHLFNGIWGTLAVAIFNEEGFSIKNLGVQAAGAFSITLMAFVLAFLAFHVIRLTVGLRASEQDEEDGLDFAEHASNAYPDFTSE